jgi:hypothetical protein
MKYFYHDRIIQGLGPCCVILVFRPNAPMTCLGWSGTCHFGWMHLQFTWSFCRQLHLSVHSLSVSSAGRKQNCYDIPAIRKYWKLWSDILDCPADYSMGVEKNLRGSGYQSNARISKEPENFVRFGWNCDCDCDQILVHVDKVSVNCISKFTTISCRAITAIIDLVMNSLLNC